jgi:hypothetical protein
MVFLILRCHWCPFVSMLRIQLPRNPLNGRPAPFWHSVPRERGFTGKSRPGLLPGDEGAIGGLVRVRQGWHDDIAAVQSCARATSFAVEAVAGAVEFALQRRRAGGMLQSVPAFGAIMFGKRFQ